MTDWIIPYSILRDQRVGPDFLVGVERAQDGSHSFQIVRGKPSMFPEAELVFGGEEKCGNVWVRYVVIREDLDSMEGIIPLTSKEIVERSEQFREEELELLTAILGKIAMI